MRDTPQISIIIPARDEEDYIEDCLKSIRDSAASAELIVEIVVVINRSTDLTEQIAKNYGAKTVHDESQNLSKIRNAGVRASSSELVVTIDADSRMSKNLLPLVYRKFQFEGVVAGGTMIYTERVSLGIIITGMIIMGILLLRGISVGCFFFTRKLFEEVGGFDEELVTAEDLAFASKLRRQARQNKKRYSSLYRAYITTSVRKFDEFGDWYMIRNPITTFKLLKGSDQELGNRFWYDVNRSKKSVEDSDSK